MKIRKYNDADKKEVTRFVFRLRKEIYGSPLKDANDLKDIPKNYYIFLIVEEKGKIVGTCGLGKTAYGDEIRRVYLEKEFRGKGIGKELIKKVFAHAKKVGLKRITLFTRKRNLKAIKFFKKVGLTQTVIKGSRVYFEKRI